MDLLEARYRGFTAGIRHPWELARLEVVTGLITDAWIAAALTRIGIALPGLSNYAVCRKSA